MAINDDGTKLIVYGGRLESNAFTSELFILTIATGTWAVGASSPLPRIYSACTIAGDQLIVWCGLTTLTEMAPKEVMIYDMNSNTWVEQYTPTAPYVNQTVPPIPGAVEARPSTNATLSAVSPPDSTVTEVASSGGDSAIGIIAGSVLGVLGMCFIIFVVYQQQRRQGEQDIGTGGREGGATDTREPQAIIPAGPKMNAVTASATALYSQNPQGSVYGSAGGYQDPQSPHGVQVADDIQVQLREFKQMELREQLLILQEQAQPFQPGSQYQQQQNQQQQYQQQVPAQHPVTMGVSYYPATVGTVQALPVTNSTVLEQYYPAAFIGEL
ncbi:hypothetical protein EC957_005399 [Mortierella hygrophila]|uniref:Uncharacterized protein n=1 Tax=Mortierella hygrophila TaxID=979708 RepID=A0A9P6F105_9FUNG|nr:hypothetical protein EC957_005399 [Mortierella hygrophila]